MSENVRITDLGFDVTEPGDFFNDLTAPEGAAAIDGLIGVLRTGGPISQALAGHFGTFRQIGRDIRDLPTQDLSEGTEA